MLITPSLAAVALISSTSGTVFTGAGGIIPDATISNSIAGSGLFSSTAQSSVTVGLITGVKMVSLNSLSYSWVGDLQVTIVHVNTNSRVDLFSRFGVTTATNFGSSKDLNGNYSFTDGAGDPVWNPVASPGVYPSGTYQRIKGPDLAVQVGFDGVSQGLNTNTFATFIGLSAASAWSLEIRDFGVGSFVGGNLGTLTDWSIEFEYIPTPGALALLGVAGFAGRRRRA